MSPPRKALLRGLVGSPPANRPRTSGSIDFKAAERLFKNASRADGLEASRLYDQAIDKYRSALALMPTLSQAAYQLGRACRKVARIRPSQAASYRQEATKVLTALLARDGDNSEARFQLELIHAEEANERPSHEIRPRLEQLINRPEPTLHNLRAWSYGQLASMAKPPECHEKFAFAVTLMASADHSKGHTFELWGSLLCKWAQRSELAEANRLLALADEKAQSALQIDGSFAKALNLWGVVPKTKAARVDPPDSVQLLGQSLARFQMASLRRPRDVRHLLDWSDSLVELALLTEGATGGEHLKQAEAKARAACDANPESSEAWTGLGWVEFVKADFFNTDNPGSLLNNAASFYEKALSFTHWTGAALAGLGHVRLAQGRLADAKNSFNRAEEYRRGAGAYGLARLAARRGCADDCHEELAHGFRYGWAPSRVLIARDRLFNDYRSLHWLGDFPFRLD